MSEKSRANAMSLLLLCLVTPITLRMHAQRPGPDTAAYAFDVVSIKPHDKNDENSSMRTMPEHFQATNTSLASLVVSAYGLQLMELVSGIPKALEDQRFDVDAKLDAETAAALKALPKKERYMQQQLMMRSMLEDRFKLKAHAETREIAEYALVTAKTGFKLKPADPNNTYANGIKGPDGTTGAGNMFFSYGHITTQACTMATFASVLQGQLGRPVVDRTGIAGTFDIDLHFRPEDEPGSPQDGSTEPVPTLYTALGEQLGLKLEPIKGPAEAVVVDHAEMPTAN